MASYILSLFLCFLFSLVSSFSHNGKINLKVSSNFKLFGRHKSISYQYANNKNTNTQQLAYFYLRDKLKISDKSLMNIVVKYPWLLYLKVENNIRPTIDAYRTFGFKMSDVRMLVEAVPSTLGLNANWSIPERLISLQKLFYLSQPALIKAVKRQPYLVTCSVNRHIDIANFFSESLGMTSSEIRNMATYFPDVIMSNLDTLQKCYSILSDVYGFSTDDIRYICVQCPRVFTKTMLQDSDARLDIFRTELNLVPPFEDIQKLVLKVPSVLCMSADYFLLPNIQLIKEYLYLSSMDLGILISSAPLLLRYRPLTLRSKLESTFTFLTSENKSVLLNGTTYNFRYRDLSVQFVDAIFDGKSVESLFTYQPILLLEEKVVLSDDSTSEESEISSLEILMQKLVNQSDDTLLPNYAPPSLITDEETGFTNFIPDELIDLDLVESDEVSVDLGSGRSWGDRVKCPFSTPDDLLRLDVISDIAQHFDGWDNQSGVNEKVNINNDASRARLLSEVDNLDGRSSEATLSSLTSIDKEAVRWILKESALLRLPSTRARLAVKMFLPILGYDPMRLHK